MAVFLIDIKTGRYYQSPAQWTEHRCGATDFESATEAICVAYEEALSGVELLMQLPAPILCEVRMQLRSE